MPTTESDCEVIIHMYLKYGFQQTLQMLDGVFAFVLYDTRDNTERLFAARDSIGIRPLYYLKNLNAGYMSDKLIGFASELKCLDGFVSMNPHQYAVEQFKPGTAASSRQSRQLGQSGNRWFKIRHFSCQPFPMV